MEQPRRGRVVLLAAILVALAGAGLAAAYRLRPPPAASGTRVVPGETDRVVVEVLNATAVVGLARTATRALRDAGLDVVSMASDTTRALDSTEVLVRRGAAAAGERVAKTLGGGMVRAAPDPARLVDVTVRLGRDFAARAAGSGRAAARDP